MTDSAKMLLRHLPKVDALLVLIEADDTLSSVPRSVRMSAIRLVLDSVRQRILAGEAVNRETVETARIFEGVKRAIHSAMTPNLRRTLNATGVVVHTNLGRSLLSDAAMERVQDVAQRYSNLELDLATGKRGIRYSAVEDLLCEITGAEAAMLVNNNAAAVLLCLDAMANGKEVITSRGELVEIGGSFRVPDVMEKSGAILKEVGTTNRTHPRDYENAVTENTGLLLKVHTSNFAVVGFTRSVSLEEMVAIGKKHDLPVMEDLGSGTFVDFSKYGLAKEPTVQESVAAGVDIVTFSGDKLLGGPQAGIIVGSRKWISRIRKNPLTRALRIDKLTLAALEGTLRLYREPERAAREIPSVRMITLPFDRIQNRAETLAEKLSHAQIPGITLNIVDAASRAGGGALPVLDLPTRCVTVAHDTLPAARMERRLREATPPVMVRIEDDRLHFDVRTLQEDELDLVVDAVRMAATSA